MAIVTFIVDCSGFTNTWKGWLGKWLKIDVGRVRPFDCSLCMTWWVSLAFLLIVQQFTLINIVACAAAALLAKPTALLLGALLSLAEAVIEALNKLIDKIYG